VLINLIPNALERDYSQLNSILIPGQSISGETQGISFTISFGNKGRDSMNISRKELALKKSFRKQKGKI